MAASRDIDWESVVAKYGPSVWRTVYRMLGNREDASDCFQETFISAFRVSQRQEVGHWPALLKRLAASRAVESLRKGFRESGKKREFQEYVELPASNPPPPQQVEAAELKAQSRWAIAQLPRRQAGVFCLRYLDGLSNQEIAEQLRLKPNAVRVALHRASKRLRSLLKAAAVREEK